MSLSVNCLLDRKDTVLGEAGSTFEWHLGNMTPHDMMPSKMPENLAAAGRADNPSKIHDGSTTFQPL